MALEIERKFLLVSEEWRRAVIRQLPYTQGYLATTAPKTASIRIRMAGEQGYLTIKGATTGIQRQEYEYPIPLTDAQSLLATLCLPQRIEKIRYWVPYQGHTWEIDEFQGANTGLILAEIELSSPDEEFVRPPWLGMEVSLDNRYYNAYLAQHPYPGWATGNV